MAASTGLFPLASGTDEAICDLRLEGILPGGVTNCACCCCVLCCAGFETIGATGAGAGEGIAPAWLVAGDAIAGCVSTTCTPGAGWSAGGATAGSVWGRVV